MQFYMHKLSLSGPMIFIAIHMDKALLAYRHAVLEVGNQSDIQFRFFWFSCSKHLMFLVNPKSATYILQQTTISNFVAISKITNKACYYIIHK